MKILTVTLNPAMDREITIPNFETNQLQRIFDKGKMQMNPGGKGLNVSMMLSSLGIPSIAMGFLGGYMGKAISSELSKRFKDITVNFIHIEDESRENIAVIDEVIHQITEINAPGPTVSEEDLIHFMKLYNSVVSQTDTTVISGSVPYGIPLDIYATLCGKAKEKNNKVYLEARGKLLTNAVTKNCPTVVRPDMRSNNKILGNIVESLADYIEAGHEIIKAGAKLVVISYKTVHDLIFTTEGSWILTIIDNDIEEAHLLGTGDAYMTGMIYFSLKDGENYLETAKFGMACALAKTKYIGKMIPPLSQIEESLRYIKVEKLN